LTDSVRSLLKQEEKKKEIVQSCDPLTFTEGNHKLYLHGLQLLKKNYGDMYIYKNQKVHTEIPYLTAPTLKVASV
jgi:hypothetical protein